MEDNKPVPPQGEQVFKDICGLCGMAFNGEWIVASPPMPTGVIEGFKWLASYTNATNCTHCKCINEITHFKWIDAQPSPSDSVDI